MSLSVLILTHNEEVNIEGCLDSIAWCDDVVVLDSFSSDRTVEIASERGARVVQRVFDDYASQRNHGLRGITYRHPWVLMLDADERVPIELRAELEAAANSSDNSLAMLSMRRKDHLFGRWIRRSSGYPTWFGRLVRVGRVWVERPINEEYHTEGRRAMLTQHLHHFPFNKGLSAWLQKHDRYSSMEAEMRCRANMAQRVSLRKLFSGDPVMRRREIKTLVYRLPGRPLLMFFGLYVVRGGFLDGRAGLMFSLLRAWYEFMIDCKCAELRRRRDGLPV
jgi:glycosyltransferase involved in cell wall biosynthesis